MKNKIQMCVGVRKCRTQAGGAARCGSAPDTRAEPFAAPGIVPSLLPPRGSRRAFRRGLDIAPLGRRLRVRRAVYAVFGSPNVYLHEKTKIFRAFSCKKFHMMEGASYNKKYHKNP